MCQVLPAAHYTPLIEGRQDVTVFPFRTNCFINAWLSVSLTLARFWRICYLWVCVWPIEIILILPIYIPVESHVTLGSSGYDLILFFFHLKAASFIVLKEKIFNFRSCGCVSLIFFSAIPPFQALCQGLCYFHFIRAESHLVGAATAGSGH